MTACESLVPAGLGRRLAARLIDVVAAAAAMFAVSIVLGVLAVLIWFGSPGSGSSVDTALLGFVLTAAVLAAHAAYEVILTVRHGATVGKAMAGMAVVNHQSGAQPGTGQILARHLMLHVPPTVGCAVAVSMFEPADMRAWAAIAAGAASWALIGASAAWNPRRRGWHDRLAGTVVATADSVPAGPPPPPKPPPSAPASQPAAQPEPESWGLVSDYYTTPTDRTGAHCSDRKNPKRDQRS
ncbi:RDD family protein [Candidatus Poriferisodalis sp.]|uniref:RDD family protein n=1 Tax=Candidatus Poriferisodalis sp. TaxID=3101277 RepID=UPI003B0176EC